ncbi:aldo/keto reductase [Devosia faecipullorum]|uniref:aldo/keto reductase n=1 Tax=Devosia faecipullorum TaxID=2755039 RepID=UPI00187B831B|nr:aldo/keto reductase [Devosia faecipullorum]MBE7734584.1 aldo/keto reductase [Devosia faecipullorum]
MSIKINEWRQVGETSLSLPTLGFGAAHLGGMFERVSREGAYDVLKTAWDKGIRYFDVAPFYGRGLSEHRLGGFLIDEDRKSFVVTTKVGRCFRRPNDPATFKREPWSGGLGMEFYWDYSYDGIMRSYEQSLFRLGLDTVDALLIHDPEAGVFEGGPNLDDLSRSGIRALEELKRWGHIKAVGMGLNSTNALETIAPRVPLDFCIVAMAYTLLDQSAAKTGLQYCLDNKVSVVVGAPYASGILATGPGPNARYHYAPATEDIQDKTARIMAICKRHGVSLQAAALQFPLAHPSVVSIVPGGAKASEVAANVDYFDEHITSQLWDELAAEGLIDPACPRPT